MTKTLNEDAMQGDTLSVDVTYPGFPVCSRVRCACPALRPAEIMLVHLSTFAVRCVGDRLDRLEHTVNK